jgi:hypothetical protein
MVCSKICSQLCHGKSLPGYFECAGWTEVSEVLLGIPGPVSRYICWVRVSPRVVAELGTLTNADSRLTFGA